MWNKTGAVGEILLFLGGPLIWAAHFFIMYAAEALFCLRLSGQASASFFAYAVSSAVLAGLALLGLMAWQLVRVGRQNKAGGQRATSLFLCGGSMMLATAALLAVAWGSIPAMLLPVCSVAGG